MVFDWFVSVLYIVDVGLNRIMACSSVSLDCAALGLRVENPSSMDIDFTAKQVIDLSISRMSAAKDPQTKANSDRLGRKCSWPNFNGV